MIGDEVIGGLRGPELLDHTVARDLAALSERRTSALRHYGDGGEALGSELTVHLHSFGVPPTLVLVGAIDYSAAVAALAGQAGYRVVIVDAREAFARSARFSRVADVHVGWPAEAIDARALGPRDAVIVFSHDPKFDEPAILAALASDAGYIGALGSRRTAVDRTARLAAAGVERGGARPRALALRARHRRRDARGGRDLDHGRGDRGSLGTRRRAADQRAGLDPPALSELRRRVDVGVGAEAVARHESHRASSSSPRAPWSPCSCADRAKSARSSRTGWPGRPAQVARTATLRRPGRRRRVDRGARSSLAGRRA